MSNIKDKNNILAIDTTSNICGVAIVSNDNVLYENNLDTGLNHSITLFENIKNSLIKANMSIKDIDIIKVANGPGSFTGLRIGLAAALGISNVYNTKIEYVDSLDSLANNVYLYNFKNNNILNYNYYILSMIDARVDRVYISLYNNNLKKLSKDMVISIYELCQYLNKYFKNIDACFSFVGSGAVNYKEYFISNLKINYKIFDKISNVSASSLAYSKGVISKIPFTNYLLQSKAERDRSNNL